MCFICNLLHIVYQWKRDPRISVHLAHHKFQCVKITATYLPGSIPSVLGASEMGAKIVTFLTVTFLQSYGCNVQKGESRKVMLEITMSLDHIICTSGPLVWLRSFFRYFFHHVCPCPLIVPLCPVHQQYYICNQTLSTIKHFWREQMNTLMVNMDTSRACFAMNRQKHLIDSKYQWDDDKEHGLMLFSLFHPLNFFLLI